MTEFLLPPLAALLIWWLGTGIVIVLDGLPRATFRWSLALSTLITLGALVCIAQSAHNTSVAGAYAAFTCAVLAWGWHELTFLTGWLTGPRRAACSAPGDAGVRLREGTLAILWHELGLLAMLALIVVLVQGGENRIAPATFGVLWVMRLSAKLNLYLGVRNLGVEFLPAHLAHLPSYFRRRALNLLLPVSVIGGSLGVAWLAHLALATSGGERAGALLLASLLALAVAEHLLLVLPLPGSWLWKWALRARTA